MVATLGLLSAVGPFAIDMYLPALPGIAADLDTSVAATLTSFFSPSSRGCSTVRSPTASAVVETSRSRLEHTDIFQDIDREPDGVIFPRASRKGWPRTPVRGPLAKSILHILGPFPRFTGRLHDISSKTRSAEFSNR